MRAMHTQISVFGLHPTDPKDSLRMAPPPVPKHVGD